MVEFSVFILGAVDSGMMKLEGLRKICVDTVKQFEKPFLMSFLTFKSITVNG